MVLTCSQTYSDDDDEDDDVNEDGDAESAFSSESSAEESDSEEDGLSDSDAKLLRDDWEKSVNMQGMTELEREAKLAERAERRQQLLEKRAIQRRLKGEATKANRAPLCKQSCDYFCARK